MTGPTNMTLKMLLLLVSMLAQATAFYPINLESYHLTYDYSGQNFFDNFDFFTGPDPTNGHVKFVDLEEANSTSLAGFMPDIPRNDTKVAPVYLGVENINLAPEGRKSIRGCGTWPAYWMLGTGAEWPINGEIDVLEGVNDASANSYTLHTTSGIEITEQPMTGEIKTSNCDVNAPNQDKNAGCSIVDSNSTASYGKAFNDAQGGVFATLIDSHGIRIWFFERHCIPLDIYLGTPNPPSSGGSLPGTDSTWGTPNAVFAGPDSAFDAHFKDMQIVFDTTFCGDWAGKAWNQSQTCSKLAPTCEAYVSQNPSAFTDAYWAIQSVKVYEPTSITA